MEGLHLERRDVVSWVFIGGSWGGMGRRVFGFWLGCEDWVGCGMQGWKGERMEGRTLGSIWVDFGKVWEVCDLEDGWRVGGEVAGGVVSEVVHVESLG